MLRNYDQILCCKLIALQTFDFTGLYLLPKNDVNLTQSVRTKKSKKCNRSQNFIIIIYEFFIDSWMDVQ
jgi:hypothetical protein